MLEEKEEIESFECIFPSKTDPHFSKAVMTSSNLFYCFSFSNRKQLLDFEYIEQDGTEGHQP